MEKAAKLVGGKLELNECGREWEAEEQFQHWLPTIRDGEGHQVVFSSLCSVKNCTAGHVGHTTEVYDTT